VHAGQELDGRAEFVSGLPRAGPAPQPPDAAAGKMPFVTPSDLSSLPVPADLGLSQFIVPAAAGSGSRFAESLSPPHGSHALPFLNSIGHNGLRSAVGATDSGPPLPSAIFPPLTPPSKTSSDVAANPQQLGAAPLYDCPKSNHGLDSLFGLTAQDLQALLGEVISFPQSSPQDYHSPFVA